MKSCRRVEVQHHLLLGNAVALGYKPEGCGFDSRWGHCDFSSIQSFRPHFGPGFDPASNIYAYQEYFLGGKDGRCVGLTILPLSCDDCLEIWEASTWWNPQGFTTHSSSRHWMEVRVNFRPRPLYPQEVTPDAH
jgi:hypothetical protein